MEEPGLRVKACGALVVGDADLGAEVAQAVERARLGGACVHGRQHAELPSGFAVTPERIEQGPDAGAANERHDDVDAIGRVDLGLDLSADARLAGSVREQRRIEKRNERLGNGLRACVGQEPADAAQHRAWLERPLGGDPGRSGGPLDESDDLARERDGDANALLVRNRPERALDRAAQMQRDAIRSLRAMQVTALCG